MKEEGDGNGGRHLAPSFCICAASNTESTVKQMGREFCGLEGKELTEGRTKRPKVQKLQHLR